MTASHEEGGMYALHKHRIITVTDRQGRSAGWALALALVVALLAATGATNGPAYAAYDVTERASVNSDEQQGDRASYSPSVSADGRFVAFDSDASNLAPDDTNLRRDVFVRDRQTGATERVSVSSAEGQGDGDSYYPSISADGRFVAFYSYASNLAPDDTNVRRDVFVRDRQTGATERVSVDSAEQQGDGGSGTPSISADGRFVAFDSYASNLAPGDTNGTIDVFVRDRQAGTTERVSVNSAEQQGVDPSVSPSISADGRFVAFLSYATNLVSGDTNGATDVFVRDRQTGTTERVSVNSAEVQGDRRSSAPSISADGRFVAFESYADNLAPGDTNSYYDVFVRDRQSGTTERVSVNSAEGQSTSSSYRPKMSADGRFTAFESYAGNLAPGDTGGYLDVFVRDRQSGATERVSLNTANQQGANHSNYASISADGRFVAFHSSAANLAPGDTGGYLDVFVTGPSTILDATITGGPPAFTSSSAASLTFTSTVAGSTFECKLDAAPFFACTSPKSYSGLTQGSHTFQVRATDTEGHREATPAVRTWVVDSVAPTASEPGHSFPPGSQIGTGTVPVKLTWPAATDAGGSGIAAYELQQRVGTGAWTDVPLTTRPPLPPTTVTRSLAPETYTFQVRAKDKAGNYSAWKPGPPFTLTAHDETSSAIVYAGTWSRPAIASVYGGFVYQAGTPGSTAKLTFTGRNVSWVALTNFNRGLAEVWVDGVKAAAVDLYTPGLVLRKSVYTKAWATSGAHTVEVRVLGTKNALSTGTLVEVDAFVVTN